MGLNRPVAGSIDVFGEDVTRAAKINGQRRLEERWGVLFQDGALVSSLTVAQNIEVPIKEHTDVPQVLMNEIAAYKISMVGLPAEAGAKYPAELSGGMRKRAGLARALALDPDILFLDEPTAGWIRSARPRSINSSSGSNRLSASPFSWSRTIWTASMRSATVSPFLPTKRCC